MNTYRNLVNENNAILVVGLLTNVTLIVTAVAAFPWVRNNHHKYVSLLSFASVFTDGFAQRLRAQPPFCGMDGAVLDLCVKIGIGAFSVDSTKL